MASYLFAHPSRNQLITVSIVKRCRVTVISNTHPDPQPISGLLCKVNLQLSWHRSLKNGHRQGGSKYQSAICRSNFTTLCFLYVSCLEEFPQCSPKGS